MRLWVCRLCVSGAGCSHVRRFWDARWGADYLLKCISYGPTGNITGLVYQVGNQTTDSLFWGRPEDITMKRPYYLASTDHMSDLGGATVGALASAAMVWRKADYGYYQRLMAAAAQLYDMSLRTLSRWGLLVWQHHFRKEPVNTAASYDCVKLCCLT